MKIILSPSKTQQSVERYTDFKGNQPLFLNKSRELRALVSEFGEADFQKVMKIKGKKLQEVMKIYDDQEELKVIPAIECYTGFVFKGIELGEYNQEQLEYLKDTVRILSAMYGILKPDDLIQEYRLDMTMKVGDINLYNYWSESLKDSLEDEVIINLASKEFSKLIKKDMIDIDFKVKKDGKLKTIGTYAKKARGIMVNEIVKNTVTNPQELKKFTPMGFAFNEEISDEKSYVFVLDD